MCDSIVVEITIVVRTTQCFIGLTANFSCGVHPDYWDNITINLLSGFRENPKLTSVPNTLENPLSRCKKKSIQPARLIKNIRQHQEVSWKMNIAV